MIEYTATHPARQRTIRFPKLERRLRIQVVRNHLWYTGCGENPVKVVLVRDPLGQSRDEALVAIDPMVSSAFVIQGYCWRWSIESTFQETRSHLGLESTRGRCRATAGRAAPRLLGLYSVVAILFHSLPDAECRGASRWRGKSAVTFSDAVSAVRLWLWTDWVFPRAGGGLDLEKLPKPVWEVLRTALAAAA
jgi:hypothetical protein